MIVFRQADARYPFLWEGGDQPAGRWHAAGEGPAHYFADTPDGAWAEFLRHEEITDPADLSGIRRRMWAVAVPDGPAESVVLPDGVLTGGPETYCRCQAEGKRLRAAGARRLLARSAALRPGGAAGTIVDNGPQSGPARDGLVLVLFGSAEGIVGWVAGDAARPAADLLPRVRHFR